MGCLRVTLQHALGVALLRLTCRRVAHRAAAPPRAGAHLCRSPQTLGASPAVRDGGRALSGVALEVEIQPLVQRVMRKLRVWDGVYRRRNAKLLDLLERFGGQELGGLRETETAWGDGYGPGDWCHSRPAISLCSVRLSLL